MKNRETPRIISGVCFSVGGILAISCLMALMKTFGYPDIIRAEPAILLQRLYEQRHIVPFLYYAGVGGMGLGLMVGAYCLREHFLTRDSSLWPKLMGLFGCAAGAALYVGILRYALLFPRLAEWRASGAFPVDQIDLVFKSMNTYAGETIAEHVQFLFSTAFLICAGVSSLRTRLLPRPLAWAAFAIAAILFVGNLEFFGVEGTFFWNRLGTKLYCSWIILSGLALLGLTPPRPETVAQSSSHSIG